LHVLSYPGILEYCTVYVIQSGSFLRHDIEQTNNRIEKQSNGRHHDFPTVRPLVSHFELPISHAPNGPNYYGQTWRHPRNRK